MKAIWTLDNQPQIDDIKLPEMSLNVTVGLRPRGSALGGHLRHVSQLVLVVNIIFIVVLVHVYIRHGRVLRGVVGRLGFRSIKAVRAGQKSQNTVCGMFSRTNRS